MAIWARGHANRFGLCLTFANRGHTADFRARSDETQKRIGPRLAQASTLERTTCQGWTEESKVQNNDGEHRELTALRIAARASRSIATLDLHQKSFAQEIAERKKRLRRIISAIQQQEQMGMLPLHGLQAVDIAPADEELIHDPLRNL